MRFLALLVSLTLALGCSEAAEKPGNADVYNRIAASSDCAELQREFDTAMSNADSRQPGDSSRTISLAYAEAADARMKEVGCYK